MVWTAIEGDPIKLTTDWQYTEPTTGEYFRLIHTEAPKDGLYMIAQAVVEPNGNVQMFDSQVLSAEHNIIDGLRLKASGWASERRLAIKKLAKQPTLESELKRLLLPGFMQPQPQNPYSFVKASEWAVSIEASDFIEPTADNSQLVEIKQTLDEIKLKVTQLSDQPSSSSAIQLTYVENGDTNGIFYCLGSNQKTANWTNPHNSGAISLSSSSLIDSDRNVFCTVDRAASGRFITRPLADQWLAVDLKTINLKCNYYTLRGWSYSGEHLRNWKLQGSNDAVSWTDLDTQSNRSGIETDTWLALRVNSATAYRHYRILQTGGNSSGNNYLTLGEWELYGVIE